MTKQPKHHATARGLIAALLLAFTVSCGGGGGDEAGEEQPSSGSQSATVNERPVFRSEPPTFVLAGNPLSYKATVTDSNGDELTFTLATAPTGMTLASHGQITWTPTSAQVGDFTVTLEVRDPAGAVARQTFRVTVAAQVPAPEFRSRPPATAAAGAAFQYQPIVEDISGDTQLAFKLVQAPEGMQIDAVTGAISWQPSANLRGNIVVILEVANRALMSSQQAFVLQLAGPDNGRIAGIKINDINADGNRSAIFAGPLSVGANVSDSRILVVNGDGSGGSVAPVLRDAGFTVIAASLQIPGSIANALQNNTDINQVWVWNDGSFGNALSAADPTVAFNAADESALVAFNSSHPHFIFDSLAWRDHDNAAETGLSRAMAQALFAADGGIVLGTDDASGPLLVQHVNQVAALFEFEPFMGSYRSFPAQLQQRPNLLPAAASGSLADIESTNSYANAPNDLQPNGRLLSTVIFAANAEPLAGDAPLPAALLDGKSLSAVNHIVTTTLPFALSAVVEPPLASVTFYLDSNDNGQLDEGEPTASSNALGEFEFVGLAAGTYVLREQVPAGWQQTAPSNNRIEIVLAANEQRDGFVFANRQINLPPQFTSAPSTQVAAGQTYSYDADATDPNPGDVLTYALQTAPAAMSIDPISGQIQWLTTAADVGTVTVEVTAIDPVGARATQRFDVVVAAVGTINRPPQITSTPLTQINERQRYQYQLTASDPDAGDQLTYSLVAGPSSLTINPTAGLLSWLPAPTDTGPNAVTVRVTDRAGLADTQAFVINVLDVNEQPQITSTAVTAATEGIGYRYAVTATDPDIGDTLAFSLQQAPLGMLINTNSGVINWTPAVDQVGAANVRVRVSDLGGLFSEQAFSVAVANVNNPPQFTSMPVMGAVSGQAYHYLAQATDADLQNPGSTEQLTFSLDSAIAGMQINPQTGAVSWTPLLSQVGTFNAAIRVIDSSNAFATQSYQIVVSSGNQAPQITSTAPTTATVGQAYQYQATATDPNVGDPLTFSIDAGPTGLTINPISGLVEWAPVITQTGTASVAVRVTDAGGLFDVQNLNIKVSANNSAPRITSTAVTTGLVGANGYSYQVQATDDDLQDATAGEVLSYRLPTAPVGMTIDSASGLISWSPTFPTSPTSPEPVVVRVTDRALAFAEQSFAVTINPRLMPADPLRLSVSVTPQSQPAPAQTEISLFANGDGSTTATLSLTVNGVNVPLDAGNSAVFTMTAPGRFEAIGTATTPGGATVNDTEVFRGTAPKDIDPPRADISEPKATAQVRGIVPIIGTATDANLFEYRLEVAEDRSISFVLFDGGTQNVTNDQLGVLDTSGLIPGNYNIRLTVEDVNGATASDTVLIQVLP